jgi:PEP-CTERM motif
MKKVLVFLLIAMLASFAGAQTLTWYGDSAVYNPDVGLGTWYNCSASWAGSSFDTADFGLVSALTLGSEIQLYYTPDGTWPQRATVTMDYQVDALASQSISMPWLENSGNNEKYQNFAGADVIAGSGLTSAGDHTVAVWFHINDNGSDVYDNNGGANWTADFSTAAVPEPATMSLLGLGALAMVLRRKMRK